MQANIAYKSTDPRKMVKWSVEQVTTLMRYNEEFDWSIPNHQMNDPNMETIQPIKTSLRKTYPQNHFQFSNMSNDSKHSRTAIFILSYYNSMSFSLFFHATCWEKIKRFGIYHALWLVVVQLSESSQSECSLYLIPFSLCDLHACWRKKKQLQFYSTL